ncbi:MAG: PD-(D/E)XK nuclease family protein, partial [Bacteroidota bacterium]
TGSGPQVEWVLPQFAPVPVVPLDRPVAHLHIDRMAEAEPRQKESPTALEDLLYYPHKWVFRHQLELRGTPILSIASENRLRGNLSHLFVERLLNAIKEGVVAPDKTAVQGWVYDNADTLLQREGAVLLEYGQEPERIQFVRTMAYSAWSLVHYINENGWRIRGSEERVMGELEPMGGQEVRGRADLVLEREKDGRFEVAVVDLKWRGKTVFRNLLRNAKDVQLCLYAEFIRQNWTEPGAEPGPQPGTVHTAYYILRDAQMLSRNEMAFANIETESGPETAEVVQAATLKKIRATYNWRWDQFAAGVVEVRCADTLGELEDRYLNEPHDERLEMEQGDARFDDYRSLIGLVR